MTRISTIHGIPDDENAGRALTLSPKPFIPYLSLTKGEMQLALLQEQATILAEYYGAKEYGEAAKMIDNALNAGVHNRVKFIGAVPDYLQNVAYMIRQAERNTQPASRAAFYRPGGIGKGVHIGAPIIDYDARGKACLKWAETGGTNAERKRRQKVCEQTWRIEKILNDGMENCGQYLAYGYLAGSNALPPLALYKIQDGIKAQEDISRVGKFDIGLTRQWLNVGMMRRNADTAKIKPYGFSETNAILMALPEAGQQEVIALLKSLKDKAAKMGGAIPLTPSQVGNQIAQIVRKYKQPKVGEPVTVTLAIIAGITALIGAIAKMASAIKGEQVDAFSQVNGFGTREFGPMEGDWNMDGIPDTTGGGMNNTTLLILAAGAALLLMDDK